MSDDGSSSGSRAERIARLNNDDDGGGAESLWLPREFVAGHVVPIIVASFVALSVVFACAFLLVEKLKLTEAHPDRQTRRKVCYQMTNFCANCFLGFAGLYHELFLRPRSVEPEESTGGYEDVVIFSAFQLGFQLWAIPIGLFWVNEPVPMLAHHVAVIFLGVMSAFLRNGFRYWTPFFFGLVELSSVPLAVMNTFKDNPAWIKRHQKAYLAVRLAFAASFLWIRLVMTTPRMLRFLGDHYLLFSARPDNLSYQVFMAVVWTSSLFLLLLQYYWGSLILRGLVKLLVTGTGSSSSAAAVENGAPKNATNGEANGAPIPPKNKKENGEANGAPVPLKKKKVPLKNKEE